ncbi:unnamed protein product [Prorocentrum cordatum]|uniref:Aldehyde dehydrogenase n=1 Tax=Prorocentrum cordatum TaxID=2364126 RepID=A0ABN9W822_9DINO|nr:unnamed protein product [Polarella glacialis]
MAEADIYATYTRLAETFKTGRTKSYEWRFAQISNIRRMLTENLSAVEQAIKADLGRPKAEAMTAEVFATVGEIDYALKHLKEWMAPEAKPTPLLQKPGRSVVIREPKGLILDLAPWNFPINLSLSTMVGIISAGNCCVLKPSEVSPKCEQFLKEYIPRYCDPDAIAVVTGGVAESQLLLKLRWDHIVYTGNSHVAKEILAAAAQNLTPCTLELGGKSPTVVLPGANVPVAARRILAGKCMNAGQICIAPDYALVHEAVAEALEAELKKSMQAWYGDDAQQSASFGRIINQRHFQRVKGLVESAGVAEVYQQGRMDEASKFIPPTLIKNPGEDSDIMKDEIFGPVLPFITCRSLDEIVERINSKEKPLALYIFGREADADEIIRQTSSGGVCVNDTIFHIATPELPFGGVGNSGMGSYHGKWGFDEFSHKRSVMYRATWADPSLRYPPYTDGTVRLLEKVMVGPLLPEGAARRLLSAGAALGAAGVWLAVRRSRL